MATRSEDQERVAQLMAAAHPVAALAARVGHDGEYAAQLVRAAHADDPRQLEQLLLAAGVSGTTTIQRQTGQQQVISIHIDIGPIHISIDVKKSK